MATMCRFCDKPVALYETAWTCGLMFCSHRCGVKWAKTLYKRNEYKGNIDLRRKATAYFNATAEEISREDYGARAERFTAYSAEHNVSTIFEQVYEGDELVAITCVVGYVGQPDANYEKTALFNIMVEETDCDARTERFTAYSVEYDISSIFEQVYKGDELVSTTCIGWYFGRPNVNCEEPAIKNGMTALFVE